MAIVKKQDHAWAATCKRFVAFIDIMGFKDFVFRNDHQSILNAMQSFRNAIYPIDEDTHSTPLDAEGKLLPGMVRPLFFSDSILLISSDDSSKSAESLLFKAQWLLGQALLDGIPVKGAIAYGEQTADFDASLHFGRPLIDAYELQNELFLYAIALHHTMEHYLITNKLITTFERSGIVCIYPTPMKGGTVTHYLTRWDKDLLNRDTMRAVLSKLYSRVSGLPRQYVDNTANLALWHAKNSVKTSSSDRKP